MSTTDVTVIGAGLAGCEAAWQLAQGGVRVRLIEMKPLQRTPAQVSDFCAELVCSNSLRSNSQTNAVGLLKEEMRRLGSLIIDCAWRHRVPAGDALAVDRIGFGTAVTQALDTHPNIKRVAAVADNLPRDEKNVTVVATGPLTDPALAADIAKLTGDTHLYFYDAIAPIVSFDSIDMNVVFAQSRYDKGDGKDYLNCPMDEAQYATFHAALVKAECMPLHDFESPKYFQGCMPAEVVATSGLDALRFGAMKPVGLRDPRTGKRPHAVVQLRREDVGGQAYNLVGFQTKMKYPEQKRVLRLIPGLKNADFLRFGAIHRNTYLNSPSLLDARMHLRGHEHILFAGQITGVEGYVESAAHGLMVALLLRSDLQQTPIALPPIDCALGALMAHVRGEHRLPGRPHEPANINWAMFPPAPAGVRKNTVKEYRVRAAHAGLEGWAQVSRLPLAEALKPAAEHVNLTHAAPTG